MLAFAGRPFILGNAAPELRRDGWSVTLSNDQNGVAAAVEQVFGAAAGTSFS
jgi:hydroxymethylpyrimidine pyrophosphatase-like HAD family hydrolase